MNTPTNKTSDSPEYEFRRIDGTQLPAMQQLLFRSFGLEVPLEDIRAKYATEEFGLQYIGFLAYAPDGSPAAYYGVFPIVFSIDGKRVLAAQSGDTMTDPAHQKRGLFTRTARKAYELAAEQGISFVFGFPNEQSLPGFKRKLEWQFTGHIQDFKIGVSAIPLAAMAYRWKFMRKWYESRTARILKKYAASDEEVAQSFGKGSQSQVCKDGAFFRYKQFSGAVPVRYSGFSFYVKVYGQLVLGEVAEFPPSETDKFIKALKGLAAKLGCHKCLVSISENHWLLPLIQPRMEQSQGLPIGFRDLESGLNFEELVFSRADFDTF